MSTTPETTSDAVSCRRFSLGVAVIAVAAVAVYLAFAKLYFPIIRMAFVGVPFDQFSGPKDGWHYLSGHPGVTEGLLLFGTFVLIVFLFVCSLAFAAMRLCKPRPPLGVVLAEPGMAAFLAVVLGFCLAVLAGVLGFPVVVAGVLLASAVPLTWATLAIRGRWRAEPGWIDRLGRVLGYGWCLVLPFYLALLRAVLN